MSGPTFSPHELEIALKDVQDVLGRCLVPFFLTGQTARDIVDEKPLSGSTVTIGTQRKHWTKEAIDTLRTLMGDQLVEDERGYSYIFSPKVNNIPVRIAVVKKRYQFLDNLDFKFFMADEYFLPNPFEKYWKARFFVT